MTRLSEKIIFVQLRMLSRGFIEIPTGIYLFKVNNGITRTMSETCLKLTFLGGIWAIICTFLLEQVL